MNCDLGEATRTLAFKEMYPERFIEVGIAEANAISIAAGLSKNGLKPFVTSFGHFLTGKFLEIFQSVGLNDSNVTLVGTHAGLAIGKDGPTQMGLRDIALMRLLPNFSIYQPFNENQTKQIMDEILQKEGPKYLRLNRQPQVFFNYEEPFNFGLYDEILLGENLLLITQGAPTVEAYQAIESIEDRDKVGLISISSMPVNQEKLSQIIYKYKQILIIEDHYCLGGISDLVARVISENNLNVHFNTLSINDYGQSGSPEDLYRRYKLDKAGITQKINEVLGS